MAFILATGALAGTLPVQARAADSPLVNTAQVKRDAHAFGQAVKHDSTVVGHTVKRDSRTFGHRFADSAREAGHRINAGMHQAGHAVRRWWTGVKSSFARTRASMERSHSA